MGKMRLDQLLVERGLCETRTKAQARILAGDVLVEDRPITKAGTLVPVAAHLRLRGDSLPYVSRGGLKLVGALQHFPVSPQDKICFDAGASTGGFTDVLLQQGAQKVYAVDVGTNQLHWQLRQDSRVVSIEKTNLRHWEATRIPDQCDLLVADLSFISVTVALPPVLASLKPDAQAIILVKPQFEAGREEIEKGGIVRDSQVHERVCQAIWAFFNRTSLKPQEVIPSPILGGEGNREFLLYLKMNAATQAYPAG